MKIRDFRDLKVWQLGKEIVRVIYVLTQSFPKDEVYGLTAQLRRAAISVPSNVAEGFSREHNKDYRRFLFIALGSCAEMETQIEVAFDLNYITGDDRSFIVSRIKYESRMVWNLIKRLSDD